jgi:hypothetical protein
MIEPKFKLILLVDFAHHAIISGRRTKGKDQKTGEKKGKTACGG